MPKVDVVIVNWNSKEQARDCVKSLLDLSSNEIGYITVVDNGSTDGSDAGLDDLPGVQVHRAGVNLGFGAACNVGAKNGKSEFILLLNPDALVYKDTIKDSLEFMSDKSNQQVGVCGVQLKDEQGHVAKSCTRLPTVHGLIAHALGIDRIFPSVGHFMSEWDHNQTRSVDHVIGAFYLIRRSLFEHLGGFDQRFFVYLEDLDLSNRVKAEGWDIKYLANVQAFHKGGGTSDQVKALRLFYSLRSRIIYAFKHFNLLGAILVLLATMLIEPFCRIALSLLKRSLPSIKETAVAYSYLYAWLPRWIVGRYK